MKNDQLFATLMFCVWCLPSIGVFAGFCRVSVCHAQVSDVGGAGWIVISYSLQSDGSLQRSQLTMSRRGVTAIEFSLRSKWLVDEVLKLNPSAKKKVEKLLKDYDAAKRDPIHEFGFDYRNNDPEVFSLESPKWQKAWRLKLEEALDPESLSRLDQVSNRWMIGSLGLENLIFRHQAAQTSFLNMNMRQTEEFLASISASRKRMTELNQLAFQNHLTKVVEILSAEQKLLYEQEYANYTASQRPPIELLMCHLSLSEDNEIVKESLKQNLENPDAWLSLPSVLSLNVDGALLFSMNSSSLSGESKLRLLEDLKISDVMELSTAQSEELAARKIEFDRQVEAANIEYNRKRNEAAAVHGFDLSYNPYPSEKESKIFREISQNARIERARLNRQLARDIDQVLVPKQIEFLGILATRSELRVFGLLNCLRFGRLGNVLKISDKQKERLARLQEAELKELKNEAAEMENEFLTKWTKLLTKEQNVEWEKLQGPIHAGYLPIPNLLLIETQGY